jgi:hypothetical protein
MRDLVEASFRLSWTVRAHLGVALWSSALTLQAGSVTTTLYMAIYWSGSNREMNQAIAMGLPPVIGKVG